MSQILCDVVPHYAWWSKVMTAHTPPASDTLRRADYGLGPIIWS